MHWKIREATANDISFIYATWLNSYHYDSSAKSTQKNVFMNNYKLVIDYLLDQSTVLVACTTIDEDVILGYLVFEEDLLHYCFVKEAFRLFGIATDLLKQSGLQEPIITHRTKTIIPFLKDRFVFNPFKLYKGVPNGKS